MKWICLLLNSNYNFRRRVTINPNVKCPCSVRFKTFSKSINISYNLSIFILWLLSNSFRSKESIKSSSKSCSLILTLLVILLGLPFGLGIFQGILLIKRMLRYSFKTIPFSCAIAISSIFNLT